MNPMESVVRAAVGIGAMALLIACDAGQSAGPRVADAQSMGTTSAQPSLVPTIDYASQPAAPRAGDNAVDVVVRDTDGVPIPDLSVTVTYFMPAMPSMNMPEMRDRFVLTHQGGGRYAGKVRLSMGGTWIVTVEARRDEQQVARKQLTIIADQ